jgi:sugar/nucleoside kinase (ribokinase family)
MRYGAKIPFGSSYSTIGGNAANNATGSARLNLKVAIYTNIGNKDDDAADDRIKAKLKKEGVDTSYIVETSDLPSNHHIILDFKGERTILTNHQPWKFNLPDLGKSKWIYLTSTSSSFKETDIFSQIVNYTERNSVNLAYQPGTSQIKLGLKKSTRILSLTKLFIVNLEEAKMFLGYDPGENIPIKKLLKKIADLGPKRVIITDGRNGSYGYEGEIFYKLECFPAKLVEMTGAGDAYATGTVAGLINGESLEKAMRWGAANSASVVGQIGPQAGLLSLDDMRESLKKNKNIIAKEI